MLRCLMTRRSKIGVRRSEEFLVGLLFLPGHGMAWHGIAGQALGLDHASLWILSVTEDDHVQLFLFSLPVSIYSYLFLSSKSKTQAGSSLLLVRHLQSNGIDSLLRQLVVYYLKC